jgi:hypothetical protein
MGINLGKQEMGFHSSSSWGRWPNIVVHWSGGFIPLSDCRSLPW